ncbi:hypothetical protein E2C01_020427 [Portunus trituberculatus]|uniref:Uncharacterized protein n=1 Tax=Portunus trituberculatus TaxID=210409 RepID=A0A5B7E1H1_PORTR|nr:hypothetical protein [Portunus trituberculatus]
METLALSDKPQSTTKQDCSSQASLNEELLTTQIIMIGTTVMAHSVTVKSKSQNLPNFSLAKFTFGGRVAMDHTVHIWQFQFKLGGPMVAAR